VDRFSDAQVAWLELQAGQIALELYTLQHIRALKRQPPSSSPPAVELAGCTSAPYRQRWGRAAGEALDEWRCPARNGGALECEGAQLLLPDPDGYQLRRGSDPYGAGAHRTDLSGDGWPGAPAMPITPPFRSAEAGDLAGRALELAGLPAERDNRTRAAFCL